MILTACIIWVNVRKLSSSAKRFIFGCFFLGLAFLVGAWKIGCIAHYEKYIIIYTDYMNQFRYWGALCILLASLLPIVCKQKCTHMAAISKIFFWVAVLLLDFVVAMPNIWEDEQQYKCLYYNYAKNICVIKTLDVCTILYGQDSLKRFSDDSTRFRSVHYYHADYSDNLWISKDGDSIYLAEKLTGYEITRPSGESFYAANGSPYIVEWYATNCWQYNAWWKLKNVFNHQRND